MNELLMIGIILAFTCLLLLLLLRTLLVKGRIPQKEYHRIYFLKLENDGGDSSDGDTPDEWPSVIGIESDASPDQATAEERRISWAMMQERIFRLMP